MNYSLLSHHNRLVSLAFGTISIAVALCFGLGVSKTWVQVAWLDVLGEGGIAILTMVWVFFLLVSRPTGRVTNLLVVGLCCYMFSALLDLFDEFVYYQDAASWLSLVESMPALIGMVVITYGLYLWHQEQLILNQQLKRREYRLRAHDQVDYVTKLYRAEYMKALIQEKLNDNYHDAFSIVLLDMDNFDDFNRQYGAAEGDRLLREVSELILMNLRQSDLACRFAGDRFVLLFSDTDFVSANEIAKQISNAVKHLSFKLSATGQACYQSLTFATEESLPDDNLEQLLARATRQLELCKGGY
ncbi:GGDEF domain-containing protein [Thalassotalea ganghwensis]